MLPSQAYPLGAAAPFAAPAQLGPRLALPGIAPLSGPGFGFGALEDFFLPALGAIAPSIPLLPQLSANLSVILPTAGGALNVAAAQSPVSAIPVSAAAPGFSQSPIASTGSNPSSGGAPLLGGLAGLEGGVTGAASAVSSTAQGLIRRFLPGVQPGASLAPAPSGQVSVAMIAPDLAPTPAPDSQVSLATVAPDLVPTPALGGQGSWGSSTPDQAPAPLAYGQSSTAYGAPAPMLDGQGSGAASTPDQAPAALQSVQGSSASSTSAPTSAPASTSVSAPASSLASSGNSVPDQGPAPSDSAVGNPGAVEATPPAAGDPAAAMATPAAVADPAAAIDPPAAIGGAGADPAAVVDPPAAVGEGASAGAVSAPTLASYFGGVTSIGSALSAVTTLASLTGDDSIIQASTNPSLALSVAASLGQSLLQSLVQNVTGLLDIVLTDANANAGSLPTLISDWESVFPLEVDTPLSAFVKELKNLTVPTNLAQAEAEVQDLISVFCTPRSFTPQSQEPAACSGEIATVELVPWSCNIDDSTNPNMLTCIPASLQLIRTPASCNLAYTAAMQWEDRQCQLAKTVFGKNESYTLGGKNVLLQAKDLVSHAADATVSLLALAKPSVPAMAVLQNAASAANGAASLAAATKSAQIADKASQLASKVEAVASSAVTAVTWMAGMSNTLSGLGALLNQTRGSLQGRSQS